MTDLKIGDIIYVDDAFDRKERKSVYLKLTIISENDRELILGTDTYYNGVINKRSGKLKLKRCKQTEPFYTSEEIWRTQWVVKNCLGINDAVRSLQDFEKLGQIANIAGYEPQEPEYIIQD